MSNDFVSPPQKGGYSDDERLWGLIAHLSPFAGATVGLPFLGPLVVWLIYKEKSEFVADQAKEALNFQLAVLVIGVIIVAAGFATCVSFLLVPVLFVAATIYQIIAAMEANKGVRYRYPYTFRFIK